jgi:hypothetical protein
MLIQCTKKLLEQLGTKPTSQIEQEPLFSWHANIITLNRRKTVVLVNDLTRYIIVLYGLKAKEFKKIDELIVEGIREAFRAEGIKEDVIEKYISYSPDVTFAKTKDRTCVARMNKACESVHFYTEYLDDETIFNTWVGIRASGFMVGDGKKHYIYPNEELYKNLESFTGQPIFGSKAIQLKVRLNLEEHLVWRRIIVPLNRNFTQLHDILQVAFGWKDYHLHKFTIYEELLSGKGSALKIPSHHKSEYKPLIILVCSDEAFNYPSKIDMKLESGIKLSEYLPDNKYLTYTYDLGDDWQHEIEVEKVIEDYNAPHPICIDGEGNTPPEDVGGSYGYTEFLNILANPSHPDHQHMFHWGRMQGYEEFKIEQVNRLLKRR